MNTPPALHFIFTAAEVESAVCAMPMTAPSQNNNVRKCLIVNLHLLLIFGGKNTENKRNGKTTVEDINANLASLHQINIM